MPLFFNKKKRLSLSYLFKYDKDRIPKININKSKCTDTDIMAAKKQAIIGLSLSVVSTVIVIIIIGLVIYISGRTGGMM